MSRFLLALNNNQLAAQIAFLLNLGGQLAYIATAQAILQSNITYIIELHGAIVIGIIGLEKKGNTTELKHLWVHPSFRNKGIGLKLLQKGIEYSETKIVYGAVRSDNITNIRNNIRAGMKPVCKHRGRYGHMIVIFTRRI